MQLISTQESPSQDLCSLPKVQLSVGKLHYSLWLPFSNTEAKYMVVTEVVKVAIWMKGLVAELGYAHKKVVVFIDNQSAIHLVKHHVFL